MTRSKWITKKRQEKNNDTYQVSNENCDERRKKNEFKQHNTKTANEPNKVTNKNWKNAYKSSCAEFSSLWVDRWMHWNPCDDSLRHDQSKQCVCNLLHCIALHLECYYKIICWHSISMKSHQPIKHERNTGLDLIIISHIKEKENASIANFVDKRRKRGKKTVYVFHSSNASPKRYFFLHRSYDF